MPHLSVACPKPRKWCTIVLATKLSQIQIIKAEQINEVWTEVLNKEARYRFLINAATF